MSGRWTKGPWRVYQGWVHPSFANPSPHQTNSDTAICEPLGPDKVANAHLMAAAPDMHEALEWLLHLICGVGRAGGAPEPGEIEDAVLAATTAARKAEGKS